MTPAPWPAPRPGLLAVTDQADSGAIRVVDVGGSFADEPRTLWTLRPAGLAGWGRPTDVRMGTHPRLGEVLVVPDSFGAVALLGPEGVRWSTDVGSGPNPHAAELLPDGALVVAASTGGRLLTFDPGGAAAPEIVLEGAHGVVWDEPRGALWALGRRELLELRRAPDGWRTAAALPLPSDGGHDLAAGADDATLWVTTETGVHRFDRDRRTWTAPPPALDLARVKSLDEDPATGAIVVARPEPGREPEWVTSAVEFPLDGRTAVVGGELYKVRHWRRR